MDAVDKLALLLASTFKPSGEYSVVDDGFLERKGVEPRAFEPLVTQLDAAGSAGSATATTFGSRRRRLGGRQRATWALAHTAVDAFGERR